MNIRKPKSKKKILVSAACIVVIAALSVGGFFTYRHFQRPPDQSQSKTRGINSVDYSGPTQEEQKAGDLQKETNKEREKIDAQPPAKAASVIISDANQYDSSVEVRAYIPNAYESDGTCTATFTMTGEPSVIVKGAPFKDATTTQCGAMDTTRSAFSKAGTWSVVVTYSSANASGSSAAQNVTIR